MQYRPSTLASLRGGSEDDGQDEIQGIVQPLTPVAPAALALQEELGRVTRRWVEDRGRASGTEPLRDLQGDIDAVIAKWTSAAVATPRTILQSKRLAQGTPNSSPVKSSPIGATPHSSFQTTTPQANDNEWAGTGETLASPSPIYESAYERSSEGESLSKAMLGEGEGRVLADRVDVSSFTQTGADGAQGNEIAGASDDAGGWLDGGGMEAVAGESRDQGRVKRVLEKLEADVQGQLNSGSMAAVSARSGDQARVEELIEQLKAAARVSETGAADRIAESAPSIPSPPSAPSAGEGRGDASEDGDRGWAQDVEEEGEEEAEREKDEEAGREEEEYGYVSPSVAANARSGNSGESRMDSQLLLSGPALQTLSAELEQRGLKELWVDPTG